METTVASPPAPAADSINDSLSPNDLAGLTAILAKYPAEKRFSLAILQDLQRQFNYIPEGAMQLVKEHVGTTVGQLYALATFYKALSLAPKGQHIIKLCDGTACHMRGANNLVGEVGRILNIAPGERTEDGLFSLELVNCVGSCALAPVLIIDETYYGKVTMEQLPSIINEYRQPTGGETDE
ncbi:MAG: NAD(P)H-dependent oxidoreductase subunit E [Coriobacteriales bacterium]|jgi:NADH-quinone oxidoreductase subunit E|nr:NAD(P)H-dependent oxidoreductase subunit E [Coriobacteriales bacterium]